MLQTRRLLWRRISLLCSPTVFQASAVSHSQRVPGYMVLCCEIVLLLLFWHVPLNLIFKRKLIFHSNSYYFTTVVTTVCLKLKYNVTSGSLVAQDGSYQKRKKKKLKRQTICQLCQSFICMITVSSHACCSLQCLYFYSDEKP